MTDLIEAIQKVSNLLHNKMWTLLPLSVPVSMSSLIGKTLNRTLWEDTQVSGEY